MTRSGQPAQLREQRLVETFVQLADTLVEDFDVVEFLSSLTERVLELGIAAEAGILLADEHRDLQVVAASHERAHLLELFQLESREGPCQDCFRSGRPVAVANLEDERERWPLFAPRALATGFRSVQASPLRLRGAVLGALNVFLTSPGGLDEADQAVVQAMADVATIGLIQERERSRAHLTERQLQHALHSRISIEQAKGIISEQSGRPVENALGLVRVYARDRNLKLADVAQDIVAGRLSTEDLLAAR